ncbi:MAG TPA: hypothetical protein VGC92_02575 [Phenylobacterium sp.]|jgi:hypothetical protein
MRPIAPGYPREETQRLILERIEAGCSLHRLENEPGFPSRMTVFRWAEADPTFAQRLALTERAGRFPPIWRGSA